MRKNLFIALICLMGVFFNLQVCNANGLIVEKPELKIIVNGKKITTNSSPIIINGRTLLPLRDILVNLGVQNDDNHIIWNSQDKSVEVIKDTTRIKMQINNDKVFANGKEIVLDIKPIIYGDKTYIPVRFVAESLDKKVEWDNPSSSIYIQDIKDYNDTEKLLTESVESMKNLKTVRQVTESKIREFSKGEDEISTIKLTGEADVTKMLGKATAQVDYNQGFKINIDMYIENGTLYIKEPIYGWQKQPDSTEKVNKNLIFSEFEVSEILCSGLKMEDVDTNTVSLSGKVSLYKIVKDGISVEEIDKYKIKDCFSKIFIDKDTNLIKSVYIKVTGNVNKDGVEKTFELEYLNKYTDFDKELKIERPAGLVL